MVTILFSCFIFSIMSFLYHWSFYVLMLLYLELMMLTMFFGGIFLLKSAIFSGGLMLIYMVLLVVLGAFGLALMISMVRSFGGSNPNLYLLY